MEDPWDIEKSLELQGKYLKFISNINSSREIFSVRVQKVEIAPGNICRVAILCLDSKIEEFQKMELWSLCGRRPEVSFGDFLFEGRVEVSDE